MAARTSSSDNVGKSAEDFGRRGTFGEAREYRLQRHARPFQDRLAAHNLRISHDAVLVVSCFQSIFSATGGVVDGRRWLANQGTALGSVATQLLPESRKPRKHSEIVDPTTRFGTEGSEVSNPLAPTRTFAARLQRQPEKAPARGAFLLLGTLRRTFLSCRLGVSPNRLCHCKSANTRCDGVRVGRGQSANGHTFATAKSMLRGATL